MVNGQRMSLWEEALRRTARLYWFLLRCMGTPADSYIDTSDITVNIAGGNMSSEKGNAVTVYNTEKTEGQNAEVVVTGGMLDAAKGKTALKVIMPEKGNKSELKQENGITTF